MFLYELSGCGFESSCSHLNCSNYALIKTASDNQEHGNDAAETSRRNFYIDDLLKSVNTCKFASKLVDKSVKQEDFTLQNSYVMTKKFLQLFQNKIERRV